MAGKNIRKRLSKSRQSEDIDDDFVAESEDTPQYVVSEQKVDVEIRDILRIKPQDFSALKDSFEEWASKWN